MNRLRLGMLTIAGFVWLGCSAAGSKEDLNGTGGSTNTGGGFGTGGIVSGSGGIVSGSGGIVSGSGGIVSGSGGIVSGSGGIVSGTGGVVSGTGGVAGGVECTGAATMNGRMDNGTMCGYAWTATNGEGETIDPPCGDGGVCFTGTTVCAAAEIPANTIVAPVAYTGVMIGWNVAQEGPTPSTWTSTGTGITVNYTVTGATGVERVLIQSANKDYCAVATPGVAMQWADFSVECWDGGGEVFTVGSPVTAIAVQINGDDAAAQSVELCLTSVVNN